MAATSNDDVHAAWFAYRTTEKRKEKRGGVAGAKMRFGKVRGGGVNQKTGQRNPRYLRDGGYHLLPQRLQRGTASKNSASVLSRPRAPACPPYVTISMESIVVARGEGLPSREGAGEICEQSFAATLGLLGQFTVADSDSVVALDAGATANLVRLFWIGRRKSALGK